MTILFALAVLIGFGLMLAAKLSLPRMPEWPAWACWFVASILWAIPNLGGV